jgi:pyrroline-5-carboxylate reductase
MNVGVIGCGHMGTALIAGLVSQDPNIDIAIFESSSERRAEVAARFGATDCGTDPALLCAQAEVIVLAVKPADLETVAAVLQPQLGSQLVISLLAGVQQGRVMQLLGTKQVVRYMPSLAAAVGKALVGVSLPDDATEYMRHAAELIAKALGTPLFVPEKLMPAVTGLSGSGIAFVFEFVHAMCLGAVQSGMSYDVALTGALTVLEGAAASIRENGEHPISLLSKVISPAGTTIAGVAQLHQHGFDAAVAAAVAASADRARDLES